MDRKIELSRKLGTALLALTVIGTMGCATHRYDAYGNHYYDRDPHEHATRGAVLGGLAGAGVGRAIAGHQNEAAGYFLGGAIGAITGAVIGDAIDRDEAYHHDPYPHEPPPPPRRPGKRHGHRGYGHDRHDHDDERDRDRRRRDRDDDWDDDGWYDEDDDDRYSKREEAPRFLSLPDEVLFRDGSAELQPGAERRLRAVAKALRQHRGTEVVVRGYASTQENRRRKLADARADRVRDFLLAEGVAPSRVTALGMGARFPVASDRTAEGRQRNRRAEIEFRSDDGRELARLW